MTLPASTLKLKTGQQTTAFYISGMAAGDAVVSVKSGNTKILKVVKYTKTGSITLKAKKKTGKTKLTIRLSGGAVKSVPVTVQKGTVKTTKLAGLPKKLTVKKEKRLYYHRN